MAGHHLHSKNELWTRTTNSVGGGLLQGLVHEWISIDTRIKRANGPKHRSTESAAGDMEVWRPSRGPVVQRG